MATPYVSEIKIISFNFPPRGWALCNGQTLQINQNQALFSLLGTTYGGDGQTTFALPNMQGRVAMHLGNSHVQGETAGEAAHALTITEMPSHTHTIGVDSATVADSNSNTPTTNSVLGQSIGKPSSGASFPVAMYGSTGAAAALAAGTIGNAGGSQPHNNAQPHLVLNFIIALQGIFPSRN
jgi:microcystin-dependent protein